MPPLPSWLGPSFQSHGGPSPGVMAWRLGLALLLGWAVTVIYRLTRRGEPITASFPPTLVLLTLLITMVTQVIGDNVARAFSLVGALSIVRFRTVVQDTRDTAFVIFAVVEGMAVGADHLWVALVGLGIVGAAAILGEPLAMLKRGDVAAFQLVLRVPIGTSPDRILEGVQEKFLIRFEVVEVATAGKGSSIEATYAIRLRPGASPTELVEVLNGVEEVQSVGLEREGSGRRG